MPIQYFIAEYEDKVYEIKYKHRFSRGEIVWIIVAIIMLIAVIAVGVLSYVFHYSQLWVFIPYTIEIICFLVIGHLTSLRFVRERTQNANDYIDYKILPLKDLLIKNGFYRLSSIEWLIDYSKENLKPQITRNKISFRDFFITFIFPVVIFCGNAITESLQSVEKIAVGFIGVLFLLLAYLIVGVFIPEITETTNKSRKALQVLKRDLEYIRMKLI